MIAPPLLGEVIRTSRTGGAADTAPKPLTALDVIRSARENQESPARAKGAGVASKGVFDADAFVASMTNNIVSKISPAFAKMETRITAISARTDALAKGLSESGKSRRLAIADARQPSAPGAIPMFIGPGLVKGAPITHGGEIELPADISAASALRGIFRAHRGEYPIW